MEITQTYAYRLQYSQQEFKTTRTTQLPENTPREAVRAESILLGLLVRLEVLSTVYESGEMDGDDFFEHITNGFSVLMRKARDEMNKLKDEDGKIKKDKDGNDIYDGYVGFLSDLRYIRDELVEYKEQLEDEEED